jgi:Ca-activated chloride channel family protein
LTLGPLGLTLSCGSSSDSMSASGGEMPSMGSGASQGYGGGGGKSGGVDGGVSMGGASGRAGTGGSSYADASGSWAGTGGVAGTAGTAGTAGSAGDSADAAPDSAAPDALPDAEPDVDTCAALDSSKPLVLYQSADDSNSMASPVIARRLIRTGAGVPGHILRTYEFLNYYNVLYEDAPPGRTRVVPQMRAGDEPGEYVLQIGVQSEKAPPRRPMAITFVLDNSGSMGGSPIQLEREVVLAIASAMKAGDIVSMVTWNTSQSVLLDNHMITGANDPALVAAAGKLDADGGTDLHSGLVTGYQLAKKNYSPQRMNRVVLVSDGGANVGVVDEKLIAEESHAADGEGIYLAGVGVGDGVNDTLMNVVTDRGRGAYVYVDSAQEAWKMFGPRFDETLEVAVRDIRLELTLPWYFALVQTSAEQTSIDPEQVDPQYLAPSDAIVFHDVLKPCSPAKLDPAHVIQAKATYKRPITHEAAEDVASGTVGELLAGADTQLRKGSAIVAYAEALKKAALSKAQGKSALQKALEKVQAAKAASPDADLDEIEGLIQTYLGKL